MQKTAIEWVRNPDGTQGSSWNPIKGLCPVGCWYCYGARYYERFWHLHGSPVKFYENEIDQIYQLKKPSGIFVCSIFELFHPITKEHKANPHQTWRDAIFNQIQCHPQHRFYILTKFPQNIDREMPDNVWLGVTATDNKSLCDNATAIRGIRAKVKFLSFEPMLGEIHTWENIPTSFDWIILGRLTGYGKKYDPPTLEIGHALWSFKRWGVPFFMKDNLRSIWGSDLIQEFPEGK